MAKTCLAIFISTRKYSVSLFWIIYLTPYVEMASLLLGHLLTILQNIGTPTTALDHVQNLAMDVMLAVTKNIFNVLKTLVDFDLCFVNST